MRGRNALSWEDGLALAVWYVDHRSVWLDLRILAETVLKVGTRHGISARRTTPRFEDSVAPGPPGEHGGGLTH